MPLPLKITFTAIAALTTFIGSAPTIVHTLAAVALYMIVADTITGFLAGVVLKEVSSRKWSDGLAAKAIRYAILLAVAWGFAS